MDLSTLRWGTSGFRMIMGINQVSKAHVNSIYAISVITQVMVAGKAWLPEHPCNNDGESLRKRFWKVIKIMIVLGILKQTILLLERII